MSGTPWGVVRRWRAGMSMRGSAARLNGQSWAAGRHRSLMLCRLADATL